jgi:hypothetical protein
MFHCVAVSKGGRVDEGDVVVQARDCGRDGRGLGRYCGLLAYGLESGGSCWVSLGVTSGHRLPFAVTLQRAKRQYTDIPMIRV